MAENKKRLNFGPGYQYDHNKTQEENRAAMKLYYAKQGEDIKDLTKEEEAELDELFDSMLPDLENMIKDY